VYTRSISKQKEPESGILRGRGHLHSFRAVSSIQRRMAMRPRWVKITGDAASRISARWFTETIFELGCFSGTIRHVRQLKEAHPALRP